MYYNHRPWQTHNEGRIQIRINKKKTVNITNLHDLILKCLQDRNDEKEKKRKCSPLAGWRQA